MRLPEARLKVGRVYPQSNIASSAKGINHVPLTCPCFSKCCYCPYYDFSVIVHESVIDDYLETMANTTPD